MTIDREAVALLRNNPKVTITEQSRIGRMEIYRETPLLCSPPMVLFQLPGKAGRKHVMGFLHGAICVGSRSQGVHEEERIDTKEQQERNKTRVKTVVFWPGQNVYGLRLPRNY